METQKGFWLTKKKLEGIKDGLVDKMLSAKIKTEVWSLWTHMAEPTLTNCLLVSTCTPWHIHTCIHINKCNKNAFKSWYTQPKKFRDPPLQTTGNKLLLRHYFFLKIKSESLQILLKKHLANYFHKNCDISKISTFTTRTKIGNKYQKRNHDGRIVWKRDHRAFNWCAVYVCGLNWRR